jgi:DNA helicase II / ATP-dependent DNA helicase PcrA
MPWDDDLDPNSVAYRIAVCESRRMRIVAGPGTGKSFALKRRVARLIEIEGVNPRRILPVTFTRVAAEDLHRELVSLRVEGAGDLHGRTLHSLGFRILMRQNVLQSTGRVPRPLNQYELEPLIYDLPHRFGGKKLKKQRIEAYQAAWARLQSEEPGFAPSEIDADFENTLLGWLRFHECMLIGEIIPEIYRYLHNNPAAPERRLFQQILVDEFQDLNKAEQRVIELLGEDNHLCIVGDDDQSIYSFKHANPEGIRNWHEIHANAEDFNLLQCRRCPTRVVQIANALITHNQDRLPRQLQEVPTNGEGVVQILQYQTLNDEIAGISRLVVNLIRTQNVPPGDILILAQRRVIGTPVYENLHELDIPIKSFYKESELDSVEAQERLSIFKLLVNREDRVALRWLLGYGSADFRTSAYSRVRDNSEESGLSPWAIMNSLASNEITIPYTNHIVARFHEIRNLIALLEQFGDIPQFIEAWLPYDLPNVEQLREIAVICAERCQTQKNLLEAIMEEVTQPEIPLEVAEVRIMSLHRSKGLNAPVVVIAGCIDGLLPMRPERNLSDAQQRLLIEEQRRLFFVGLTRVKSDLNHNKPGILILTNSRMWPQADALGSGTSPAFIRNGIAHFHASRFLAELGPAAPRPIQG